MPTKISSIYTLITTDDKPLKRGLVKARSEATKGAKKIQNALNKINFKAIALGATAMAATLGIATKKFIDLATKQENAEKRLGAVLRSTGQAAGYNLQQLKAMAAAMQDVTTVGDEVILSGQAMLATFKQIRGEAFERATMAALDLSDVMQQDLRSSVVMVGKALNDPIANLGALGRAGIQFTKQQKEVIKTLWQTGRVAEAQNIILDEMESQFGGAAKAAKDTFGGALKSLGNTLGDIGEKIGFAMMPPLKDMIERFNSWIDLNRKLLEQDIPGFITKIGNAAEKTFEIITRINKAFDVAFGGKLAKSVLETHLDQLKATEKTYETQLRKLRQVGKEGLSAYGKIEQKLDLVREKIKLVTAEVNESLRAEFFPQPDVLMDAHVKTWRKFAKSIKQDSMSGGQTAVETRPSGVFGVEPYYPKDLANKWDDAFESIGDKSKDTFELMDAHVVDWEKQTSKATTAVNQSFDSLSDNMSSSLGDFVLKGKADMRSFANAVISDLARIQARMAVTSLFEGVGGIFSGLFSSNVPTIRGGQGGGYGFQHGGYIGEPISGVGAKSGKSYEFHPNEWVIPKDKMGGGGNVQVIVNNNSTETATVKETRGPDNSRLIFVAIGNDIDSGGPVGQAMERNYPQLRRGGRTV